MGVHRVGDISPFPLNMMSPIQGELPIAPSGPHRFSQANLHMKNSGFVPQRLPTWSFCNSGFEIWLCWKGDSGGVWGINPPPRPTSNTATFILMLLKLMEGIGEAMQRHKLTSLETWHWQNAPRQPLLATRNTQDESNLVKKL